MSQGAARDRDWEGVRLHVVTGKGGVGKTTVAASLALALASGGRRTLLVESEGRQGLAKLFDAPPLPYAERRVAVAPGNGMVYGLAIDPEEALLEYLDLYYHLGRPGRALRRLGAIDFATTIAPGVRDVLLTGKVYEATRRRASSKPARTAAASASARPTAKDPDPYIYDAVVLDAPPTGRIAKFLNVNAEVAGLARVGPVNKQAESIMRLIRSAQTVVHLVTLLEEMPVQETLDGIEELRHFDLPVGGVIVNRAHEPLLPAASLKAAAAGQLDERALRDVSGTAGLPVDEATMSALCAEAADHAKQVTTERKLQTTLKASGRPIYQLPDLEAFDTSQLYQMAAPCLIKAAAIW